MRASGAHASVRSATWLARRDVNPDRPRSVVRIATVVLFVGERLEAAMDVVVRSSTITTAGVCHGDGVDAARQRSTLAGRDQTTTRVLATAAMPSDGRWSRLVRRLRLEGMSDRSLFIFDEHNFVRKYAKIIIEWGYPLCICYSSVRQYVRNSCLPIQDESKNNTAFSLEYLVKLQFSVVNYFSHCEINSVGVRNVDVRPAISTDPNPNPNPTPSSSPGILLFTTAGQ